MNCNQRSACLSSSVILSDGVNPPLDGCSNLAINSDKNSHKKSNNPQNTVKSIHEKKNKGRAFI